MPATQKKIKRNTGDVRKLGIIAGGGDLPLKLLQACDEKSIDVFVVGFDGQTNPDVTKGRMHMWTRLGASGKILKTLRAHEVEDLVMIGSIRRPSLKEMRPDLKTIDFFGRIGLRALGDDNLLRLMRDALEEEGFRLHGVHHFAEDLIAADKIYGKHKPKKEDWVDIKRAIGVALELGKVDVGQAVIVQEGIVLGVEAAEGTDELIARCKHLKRKGRGGVLVKLCKPQQDKDFDLPTIGPDTIENAYKIGLSGVVVHAHESLVMDAEKVTKKADKHKMFVMGIDPHQQDLG